MMISFRIRAARCRYIPLCRLAGRYLLTRLAANRHSFGIGPSPKASKVFHCVGQTHCTESGSAASLDFASGLGAVSWTEGAGALSGATAAVEEAAGVPAGAAGRGSDLGSAFGSVPAGLESGDEGALVGSRVSCASACSE